MPLGCGGDDKSSSTSSPSPGASAGGASGGPSGGVTSANPGDNTAAGNPGYWLNKAIPLAKEANSPGVLGALAKAQAKAKLFDDAVASAGAIADPYEKADALCSAAKLQCEELKKEDALKTLADATAAAGKVSDPAKKAAVLAFIAETWKLLGKADKAASAFRDATAAAKEVESDKARIDALCLVAEAGARAGYARGASSMYASAVETAKQLNSTEKYNAISNIAGSQAKAKMVDAAYDSAALIPAGSYNDACIQHIVEAQARSGEMQAAMKNTRDVITEPYKSYALRTIAQCYAEGKSFDQAMNVAGKLKEGDSIRSSAFMAIAQEQARADKIDDALETMKQVTRNPDNARGLRGIAEEMIKAGKKSDALKVLTDAAEAAKKVEDWEDMIRYMADIGASQVKAGDSVAGAKTFEDALYFAGKTSDKLTKAKALRDVAWAQAEINDGKASIKTFTDSLAVLKEIGARTEGPGGDREVFVRSMASALAREGKTAAIADLIEALKDESAAIRAWCCVGAARGMIERQRPNEKIDWDNP
jgi:tetratricopeptide (TPR) repeat protein